MNNTCCSMSITHRSEWFTRNDGCDTGNPDIPHGGTHKSELIQYIVFLHITIEELDSHRGIQPEAKSEDSHFPADRSYLVTS